MSNMVNEQILERLAEEVDLLSDKEVVKELGLVSPVAFPIDFFNMDRLRDKLVFKMFEDLPDGPQ